MNKNAYIRKMMGILLKYYRKQSSICINDLIFAQDHYYEENCKKCNKCKDSSIICSKNTLYRLEEGNSIQNECVYHRLANKFGKLVILNRMDIYNKIEIYRELLIESLIDFSKSKLMKLEANICNDLKKYENVLYVYEILLLYKQLIQDKLYNTKTSQQDLNLFLHMREHLKEEDRKILIYYFYFGSFRYAKLDFDINDIISEANEYINEPLFYQVKLNSINEKNYLLAYKELSTEFTKIEELTSYQKYWYFNSLAYVELNLSSFDQSYESLLKCLEIVKSSDFGEMTSIACYLQLGFVSYCLKDFNNTVEWILKVLEMNHPISKYLPILCSALIEIGKENMIPKIIDNIDFSRMKSTYGKRVYTYYKMKYQKNNLVKKDYIDLENYICNMLKPLLESYGEIHRTIFNNELKHIVAITGNYKKFHFFNN